MKYVFLALSLLVSVSTYGVEKKPIAVKVFIAGMFEIGANQGDKAGEFQHWFERYFTNSEPLIVKGALGPVFCNQDGVCGSVLGMGKVASSSSMQAIILNEQLDFTHSYFVISGVGGIPPSKGTIGDVNWGSWLIDYDLGHRWMPAEGKPGEPVFMPRQGYEDIRRYQLNSALVNWAVMLTQNVQLMDSPDAQAYRMRYPQTQARRKPAVTVGSHIAGDTFFHGPGLSAEAQYISQLYGADDYMIAEMEGVAIAQVLSRTVGIDRMLSLRGAVNFDQGNPNESTLAHLDPAPGETAGGFAETVENIVFVGANVVDTIVDKWPDFKNGFKTE
ncbi:purine nucleoside permease [Paraglaciecola sp. L1A13]|uniref:purine-nucleoside phosphorylase n=1 Tax=Paraglaciecola sp. L1A13 TaxID=2686359 RepID=UPI00131EC3C4|nr:purine nucleoside permease [Paraglaciecola sp. L1A13]